MIWQVHVKWKTQQMGCPLTWLSGTSRTQPPAPGYKNNNISLQIQLWPITLYSSIR
ncbi:hypothetical protein CY34DRAFT_804025 [Suillus luteus UH-Slu-Lm8-n1]|uniref:Unplaced genomic scaffold CY34scaffold_86, whole genome shotgun sequence n=1 Tax=Suillus luteus UH-Slu-Lm8-n1 TaxID=930992 RepID=A0A0D0A017_9AGAM|nr:hypothetical protein CY34DRAFT_804025 [Suillus luteus UH-Slu-Lm8-n1]